ncbi:monovalent cation:proton antiporter-2 (CPA2) family protein [Caulobacter mirabilis]|uniref:Potassium transporter n=1 Tax=Caulobacter mirabilis TaxID=69666 RepID=A0A2D2ATD3_9CAUL|nr:monovalent cation:proton antiporter-2 (CPA2) family protein [Caulobacter mirabilis]ATQ41233.1 potassium transporter [Caulobacter mirabilis]
MAAESAGVNLAQVVAVLGAGVIAGPIFKRLGFGSILGYLVAGIIIGPFGLKVLEEPETILHVAELGVIMFLFVIGLEMRPSRLWGMRRDIFGLGAAQVLGCGAAMTVAAHFAGLPWTVAFIGSMGFVLSSTAVIMQMLEERGETAAPLGQRAISILLLEDLAIVPLLAVVALLSPRAQTGGNWMADMAIAVGALVGLFIAGRYLLNPLFRLLSAARAREVMTAAALAVVLGAAWLMDLSGLSMAMGAFLAGVLLSESAYRHQLEADIEPFRGLLLGLFFIAVGMSLNLGVVAQEWRVLIIAVLGLMAVKAIGIYVVARLFKARNSEAVNRAALFAQGGEFAFVLYAAAAQAGVISGRENAIFTAAVILSMILTPFVVMAVRRLTPDEQPDTDGVEEPDGLSGSVLVIGFGRFGQIACQSLLARGVDVSILDSNAQRIRNAEPFGFKVYFGDGSRLEILHAAGAHKARVICVCVDSVEASNRIVALAKAEFPQASVLVRAFDRGHALDLIKAEVDYQVRETFESAMVFGARALEELGLSVEEIAETTADIRERDQERFALEMTGGIYAGVGLLHGNAPVPGPLFRPRRQKETPPSATPLPEPE